MDIHKNARLTLHSRELLRLTDADAGEGMKKAKDIQQPQHDCYDDHAVQD